MDESPHHEPTLIERGMGVRFNHPIAAQRGLRNPRPNRWGLWKPHPPYRGETARVRLKQDGELTSIASNGPRLGLDARLHLLGSTECERYQSCACDRSWLEHRRCRLKQMLRTLVKTREKTPAGALTLLQGFGG
jgi:hypothetical protein